MQKNEKCVKAGMASAAKRWGARGENRETIGRKILAADAEFIDTMGYGATADNIHALVEFYRANQSRKKGRVKKAD